MKKLVSLLLVLLSLTFSKEFVKCKVVRVIDGDTIRCKLPDGKIKRVRLMGIDTLESKRNRKAIRQAKWFVGGLRTVLEYGKIAYEFTKRKVLGRVVYLEYDLRKKDRHSRILAYVWIDENTLLNEILVREGLAFVFIIPPQVKYLERLGRAQEEAYSEGRGFWRYLRSLNKLD